MTPSPIYIRILTVLILCRSCKYSHSHCKYMCATSLSCLESTVYIKSCTISWLLKPFCLFFSDNSWTLRGINMLQITHLKMSIPNSLIFYTLINLNLCVNHHLCQKDVSLIKVESCANLCIECLFLVCIFMKYIGENIFFI